jgi:hypothetical protein
MSDLSVLSALLASDKQELRQLPKIVAKTFITLQPVTEAVVEKDSLPEEFLGSILSNSISPLNF